MDTIARVKELAAERNLSLHGLARVCDVPYSTLKNTEQRSGQLTVDTIERICLGLEIPLSLFFTEKGSVEASAASRTISKQVN